MALKLENYCSLQMLYMGYSDPKEVSSFWSVLNAVHTGIF